MFSDLAGALLPTGGLPFNAAAIRLLIEQGCTTVRPSDVQLCMPPR